MIICSELVETIKTKTIKKLILIFLVLSLFTGVTLAQIKGYDHIAKFGDHGISWALVQRGDKFGFVNTQGKEVVSCDYDHIERFGSHGNAWALVQKGNKYGFINSQGKEVVPVKYDNPDEVNTNKSN